MRCKGQLEVGLLLAALSCGSCTLINEFEDPAAVGNWESLELQAGSNKNQLAVKLNGAGSARLHLTIQSDPNTPQSEEFDLKWDYRNGSTFELVMICRSSSLGQCSGSDFLQTCRPSTSGKKMECSGDGVWSNYSLNWERR